MLRHYSSLRCLTSRWHFARYKIGSSITIEAIAGTSTIICILIIILLLVVTGHSRLWLLSLTILEVSILLKLNRRDRATRVSFRDFELALGWMAAIRSAICLVISCRLPPSRIIKTYITCRNSFNYLCFIFFI